MAVTIENMLCSPDTSKVKEMRDGMAKWLEKDDVVAKNKSDAILNELLTEINLELTTLFNKYPKASYIGIRFDQREYVLGEIRQIDEEAERRYGPITKDYENLVDYLAPRNAIFAGGGPFVNL